VIGVSAEFAQAINLSHQIAVEAAVLTATGETPVDVLDGTVSLDANAASRGRLDITLPRDLVPTGATSLLAPFGNELRVGRGIEFPDGTREIVPLGVYRIQTADPTPDGVRISGLDRSIRIIEPGFEDPFYLEAGIPIHEAIEEGLRELIPNLSTRFTTTSLVTPARYAEAGADRWDFYQGLALAMGCVLYFGPQGEAVLEPARSLDTTAALQLVEGEGGALIDALPSWDREDVVNRVRVVGEGVTATGAPPLGVAIDDDAASPTRYGGHFGRATYEWRSEYILTDADALHSAEILLSQKRGVAKSVSLDTLVNPAIEPYDVAYIEREEYGVAEDHMLDSVSIPLTVSGSMSAQTRVTRVVS
jgi:hypothetical protein